MQERALPTWNTSYHEYAVERGLDYVAFVLDGRIHIIVYYIYIHIFMDKMRKTTAFFEPLLYFLH
jgi:hypothetical protein